MLTIFDTKLNSAHKRLGLIQRLNGIANRPLATYIGRVNQNWYLVNQYSITYCSLNNSQTVKTILSPGSETEAADHKMIC